jgi:hypothetical protein
MKLPMHISVEQLPDQSDYYSFKYGLLFWQHLSEMKTKQDFSQILAEADILHTASNSFE